MAPPSAQSQQFRLAQESVYGVMPGPPVWRKMTVFKLNPKPSFDAEAFMPSGDQVPSVMILNDDFTEGDIEGKVDFNGIVYPLSSLFGPATITALGGGAYQWVWVWDGTIPNRQISFVCDYGQPGSADADRTPGVFFNTLEISGGRGGFDFKSSILGKKTTPGIQLGGTTNEIQTVALGAATAGTFTLTWNGQTTAPIVYNATAAAVQSALELLGNLGVGQIVVAGGPLPGTAVTVTFIGFQGGCDVAALTIGAGSLTGGTPTVTTTTPGADAVTLIKPVPVFPLYGRLYVDSTWAALGTTKMLQIYDMDLNIGDRRARTKPINADLTSDDVIESDSQEHTVAYTLAIDPVERALYPKIRSGTPQFTRAEYVGPVLGATNYTLTSDSCILWRESDNADSSDGVYSRQWTAQLAKDSVSGNAQRFSVINDLSGL